MSVPTAVELESSGTQRRYPAEALLGFEEGRVRGDPTVQLNFPQEEMLERDLKEEWEFGLRSRQRDGKAKGLGPAGCGCPWRAETRQSWGRRGPRGGTGRGTVGSWGVCRCTPPATHASLPRTTRDSPVAESWLLGLWLLEY